MKPRKVMVMMELETRFPINLIKSKLKLYWGGVVKQIQINVVKNKPQKGGKCL
uniref:Uncharacterized protein n=1 Tax=viral metagenome TaxID=1070528 RepID=A0A6M3L5M4_9ZZZZ